MIDGSRMNLNEGPGQNSNVTTIAVNASKNVSIDATSNRASHITKSDANDTSIEPADGTSSLKPSLNLKTSSPP